MFTFLKEVCMRKLISISCFGVLVFNVFSFSQDSTPLPPPSFEVDSLVFATSIDARSPVGVNTEFDSSVGKVYCWNRVSSSKAPISLKHVWYKDGEKFEEISLSIKYHSGRLWSAKNIVPGNWKVDVVDDADLIVHSGTFVVK
jgi:hypothetical protein